MGTLAEIESAIEGLSATDFDELSRWMVDRHLHGIVEEGKEAPELEPEILAGAVGPFRPLTEDTFERIREKTRKAVQG
jgi:hypothetical protein